MVNVNKLKGRMREEQTTMAEMAKNIGIATSTLYRKLDEVDGSKLTVKEVENISRVLNLTSDEINLIFFN